MIIAQTQCIRYEKSPAPFEQVLAVSFTVATALAAFSIARCDVGTARCGVGTARCGVGTRYKILDALTNQSILGEDL